MSSVAASTTSASRLAASASRKAWVVSNTTAAIAYLRFGSGAASATDFTVQLAATTGYYECPQPVYNGPVQVILASGTGNVIVTSW